MDDLKFLIEKLEKGKKEIESILGDLKDISEDELIYYIGDGIADRIGAHVENSFEFDIKVYGLEIPEEILNKIEYYDEDPVIYEASRRVESLGEYLLIKYDWIEDWYQEGRMGGWFVIKPDFGYIIGDLDSIQGFLYEVEEFLEYADEIKDSEVDDEEKRRFIEDLKKNIRDLDEARRMANKIVRYVEKIRHDLKEIRNEVINMLTRYESDLESLDWWKNYYSQLFETERESSLNKKSQLSRDEWVMIDEAVSDVVINFKKITKVDPVDTIDPEGAFYLDVIYETVPIIKEYVFKKYPEFTNEMWEEFLYKLDDELMEEYADEAIEKAKKKSSLQKESREEELIKDKAIIQEFIDRFEPDVKVISVTKKDGKVMILLSHNIYYEIQEEYLDLIRKYMDEKYGKGNWDLDFRTIASLQKQSQKIESIEDLQTGWKVPLKNGNYGLYEKGAKYDIFVGRHIFTEIGTNRIVDLDEIDWEKTSEEAGTKVFDIETLELDGVDIVTLKNGKEAMYWPEYYSHELAIWDIDAGEYVPIDMIDWEKIRRDPDSIIKEASLNKESGIIPGIPDGTGPWGKGRGIGRGIWPGRGGRPLSDEERLIRHKMRFPEDKVETVEDLPPRGTGRFRDLSLKRQEEYIGPNERKELIKIVKEKGWKREDLKKERPELDEKIVDDIMKEVYGTMYESDKPYNKPDDVSVLFENRDMVPSQVFGPYPTTKPESVGIDITQDLKINSEAMLITDQGNLKVKILEKKEDGNYLVRDSRFNRKYIVSKDELMNIDNELNLFK